MLAQGKGKKPKHMDQMEHVMIWVQDLGLMGPNPQVGKLRPRQMKRLFRVTWWAPRRART